MITLTENALEQIEKLTTDGKLVKFGVKGGGCAGFEYTIEIVEKDDLNSDDKVIQENVAIDGISLMYLLGTTVDYKTDIISSMFVFDNPLSKNQCGCGTSFSL